MKEYVITVHGIASAGGWQDDIATAFKPHFDCVTVRYPHYRRLGAPKLLQEPWILFPTVIALAVAVRMTGHPEGREWLLVAGLVLAAYLATYYRRTQAFNRVLKQTAPYTNPQLNNRIHLIAHSFGTYLTGRALRTRSDFHVGRIVYVGCVLPRKFPWATILKSSGAGEPKFLQVRNELGRKDFVVYLAWVMSPLIRGLGFAGFKGFEQTSSVDKKTSCEVHDLDDPNALCTTCPPSGAVIHNIRNPNLGHSDTFVSSGYAETYWLPFLWGIEPAEYQQFMKYCKAAAALEREWSTKSRQGGHVDPRLSKIEGRLHAQKWRWTGGTFRAFVRKEVRGRFPDSPKLNASVALAIRGTWDSVAQAQEAYLARADRVRKGLAADATQDEAIAWLNPHRAVRRAVNELPD